jgi:hypothetical protein
MWEMVFVSISEVMNPLREQAVTCKCASGAERVGDSNGLVGVCAHRGVAHNVTGEESVYLKIYNI